MNRHCHIIETENSRFYKKGKLNDKEIVKALRQAANDYENGEIIEVRDTLLDIINAIDDFCDEEVL